MLRAAKNAEDIFIRLCNKLKAKTYLKDSRYIILYEQVATFLLMIGYNCRNFIQDFFQQYEETMSHHFQIVLQSLVAFVEEMIKQPQPPSFDEKPPKILKNMKY